MTFVVMKGFVCLPFICFVRIKLRENPPTEQPFVYSPAAQAALIYRADRLALKGKAHEIAKRIVVETTLHHTHDDVNIDFCVASVNASVYPRSPT